MIRNLMMKIFKKQAWIFSIIFAATLISGCEKQAAYAPPPPPTVTVSKPVRQSVTHYAEYTGTTKAVESIPSPYRPGWMRSRPTF